MVERKEATGYSEEAREFIEQEIKHHREKGMPQDQAAAAAMSEARRKGMKVPKEHE
jgi:hypothetical protein